MKILQLDSRLNRLFTSIFDLLLLGGLYFFTSLLTLGVGYAAATTALMTALYKSIVKDEGYTIKHYINALKETAKDSTLIGLPLSLLTIVLGYNIVFLISNKQHNILLFLCCFMFIQLVLITLYTFALLATMNFDTRKEYVFNAIKLVNTHIVWSLSLLLSGLVLSLIFYLIPLSAILLIPSYCLLVIYVIRHKIIARYTIKKHM